MNKLNKLMSLLLTVACLASLVGVVHADQKRVQAPLNQAGVESHPLYGGARYARATVAAEVWISSKPCVVYGIIMSTSASTFTNYAVLRDTDVANGSGTVFTPFILFPSSGAFRSDYGWFPHPVRTSKGLTVDLLNVDANETATVVYMEQN